MECNNVRKNNVIKGMKQVAAPFQGTRHRCFPSIRALTTAGVSSHEIDRQLASAMYGRRGHSMSHASTCAARVQPAEPNHATVYAYSQMEVTELNF